MNQFPAVPSRVHQAHQSGQPYLTLLVRGQGQFAAGFAVDSTTGFALWFEGAARGEELRGPKRAQVVRSQGTPHLAIFDLTRTDKQYAPRRELLVPCVDIVGLAALDEALDEYREELAYERACRSLH